MATPKATSKPKKTAGPGKSLAKLAEKPATFTDYLFARAPAEDIAAYGSADLERAAELARKAVVRHKKGASVVAVDAESGVMRDGRAVTVITVVNDNMPFLFDSLLA